MQTPKNETDLNNDIQVRTQGENKIFSFSVPKGFMSAEHLDSFLEFLKIHEPPRVNKSLLSIYFTAINEPLFFMTDAEKFHIEAVLTMLTDLSCKCK